MDSVETELLRYGVPGGILFGLAFIVRLVVGYMERFTNYYADELDKERHRADQWERRARRAEERVAEMRHKLIIYRIPPPNDLPEDDDILIEQNEEN